MKQCVKNFLIIWTFGMYTIMSNAQTTFNKGDEQGLETGKLDLWQDSLALQEALSGWWTEAQQTQAKRMEWYSEAKFGCFIHWGVYSLAGGEWNGKPVRGYAEHLMRSQKIPLAEYKERLVKPFNPTGFNAEEWIQHAIDAGMKYFIVTAKHHDGFAMYFSDAYPYDMQMTQYKRDPMRELREAARKKGIKFGFYYSHAFDWEHPDAPGNDWDYDDHPGGDKLLHGANWWLNNPAFLSHAEKYVNEKSIPQIKELILNYDPDIMWFDTPHKLPLYENIHILKTIRELSPETIVVNGRLARFSGRNLGDYANTGDRAAWFFPVKDQYWESIPTTNESYGYSKYDTSHKPSSHFIRLLSSATAKGGNILMNVGPMGNGKWDDKDIHIFRGVGDWLKINGEAIYGNTKTGIPIQNWGVTTRKNDRLYLHIFQWPDQGKLLVGGLSAEVKKAYLLASKTNVTCEKSGDKDMMVILPSTCPDTVNTVVVLELKNTGYRTDDARLLIPGEQNTLLTFDAELSKGLSPGDGKVYRNYIVNWTGADQTMRWKTRLIEPATYHIALTYNKIEPADAGTIRVEIDGQPYEASYQPGNRPQNEETLRIGTVNLTPGEHTIVLKGVSYEGKQYMRPMTLTLTPATQKQRLNDGWLFLRSDIGNSWEAVRPASAGSPETVPLWTAVSLPHCFNAEDAVDPDVNYYQGPGWYKTTLDIRNPFANGRILLHFEGAGQKTEVYVYTTKVGSHVGGYDEWSVDITEAVANFVKDDEAMKRFNGKVPLSIRCDNSRDATMIPSDLSDFNLYGGIYRYLNLVYQPALSIDDVFVDASVDNTGKTGQLRIDIRLYNPDGTPATAGEASAEIVVRDPAGKVVAQKNIPVQGGDQTSYTVLTETIRQPLLWSPDHPNLYSCSVTLKSPAGETTEHEKFGFRHFEFVEHGPFKLNGKRLLLRGTHRHEDHAGVAAAMTEDMIRTEMKMMKEMGVNFIRLGHYQQSRIVLEQCDSLGILVWEEIPWCRGGLGGAAYQEQARRMLTNMITQHRNHPSVILWGLGNENDWPNDFPEFDKAKIRAFMQSLHTLAHQLDDTRKTAIRRCDFCKDIVDVYSPSIWAGWYRGMITDYKRVSYEEMLQVNHFLHVEWGGDSHARRHAEDPYRYLDAIETGKGADERSGDASLYGGKARASKDGEWSESYICNMIDWHLKEQETMPWLTGAAYWPFKDFSTPVRPENPVPYMNQKGVVERDFTPKESYYVFQSYWTELPMIHIYGHSWPVRWGKPNELKDIKVYANCSEVELFVNGQSYGVRKRNSADFPAAGLRWEVPFREGENQVRAVGKKGKTTVDDEITFVYQTDEWEAPAQLQVTTRPAGDDEIWVEAELRDAKGVLCLDARNFIRFELAGDGRLIQHQGTSSGSGKVQAYNGRARIRVRQNHSRHNIVVVKSEGLETKWIQIK